MLNIIINTIVTILVVAGGGGFLIPIVKKVIIDTLAEKVKHHNSKVIEEIKNHYAVNLEEIKKIHTKQIENYKLSIRNHTRYSDEQFRLYNELWSSLCDMKEVADVLWDRPNKKNLLEFANQLKNTRVMLEKSRLLLEEYHYEILLGIITTFSNFSIGKEKLIQLKRNNQHTDNSLIPYINELIEFNGNIKESYSNLLIELSEIFKSQIFSPFPNEITELQEV